MKETDNDILDIKKIIGPRRSFLAHEYELHRPSGKNILEKEDEITLPHWSLPWSDILMIVFVMFAVLFVYSLAKKDVIAAAPLKKEPVNSANLIRPHDATAEQFRQLGNSFRSENADRQVSVSIEENKPIKVSASDSLFFDTGKAMIKPEGLAFLRKFSDIVKTTRSSIRIEGHTDSFPIHSTAFPTNWELSAIRAVNIARFLIEDTGLQPERFRIVGHSMYQPAVPNDTPENKARNRRVEIFVENDTAPPSN